MKHFLKDTDSDSDVLLILNEDCIPMAMATTQVSKRHIYFRSYLEEWTEFWLTQGLCQQQPALRPWGVKVKRVELKVTNCPLCTASQHVPKIGHCTGWGGILLLQTEDITSTVYVSYYLSLPNNTLGQAVKDS